jgi:Ca2+-binding RTX toxin-like protein
MAFSKYTPARPVREFVAQPLEQRLNLATAVATTYEQYMLELINRARANPAAEAARLGIDLNEGLSAGTITTTAKQPLAMNANLVYAIRNHVTWLRVNSLFQHEGSGGSTPQSRMTGAGYSLSGNYGTAENLGLTLGSTVGDLAARTRTLYQNLFIDAGVSGRGHRTNLFNGAMEEIGVGIATGDYSYQGHSYTAIIAGQDFAYRPGNSFLTGVVYEDKIAPDEFYSPGEGLENYTITATNAAGASYTALSSITGGYSMQLPPGTYQVSARGPSGNRVAKFADVVVSTQNVKRDFELAQFVAPTAPAGPSVATMAPDGTLTVAGSTKADQISVLIDPDRGVVVQVNAVVVSFSVNSVKRVVVDAGTGDDYVLIGQDLPGATLNGGDGDDTLIGTGTADSIEGGDGNDVIKAGGGDDIVNCGAGNDQVIGEGGRDTIHGDDGNDRLDGGGGNDAVYGDTNDDRLYGGDGNDRLDGGGNVDKLYGEDGNDALIGGGSNDRLYGGDGDDVLWGNKGNDYLDGNGGNNLVRDRNVGDTILNAILA